MYAGDEVETVELSAAERMQARQAEWDRWERDVWARLDADTAPALYAARDGAWWVFVKAGREIVGPYKLEARAHDAAAATVILGPGQPKPRTCPRCATVDHWRASCGETR